MRRTLLFIAAIMTITGCSKEQTTGSDTSIGKEFVAGFEYYTKTSINDEEKVDWSKNDVLNYYTAPKGKISSVSVPEDTHSFSFTANSGQDDTFIIASYGGEITDQQAESMTLSGVVNSEQNGKFMDAHVAVCKRYFGNGNTLTFKNVTSLLKFSLSRTDVSYVTFTTNDGTKIQGNGKLFFTFNDETISSVKFSDNEGGDSIRVITGGSGLFYISTLPCEFTGFTIRYYGSSNNLLGEKEFSGKVTLPARTITDLDLLCYEEINQYDYIVATGFADWSEACFGKNGETILIKDGSEDDQSSSVYMLLPSEENVLDEFYASFDANSVPDFISVNGMSINVLSIQDGFVNVMVNIGDSLNVLIDSLAVSIDPQMTKSYSENNGVRNACAITLMVIGAVEMGTGTVVVLSSGASVPETGIVGVAGVVSGLNSIRGGVGNVSQSYQTLFEPATREYSTDNWQMIKSTSGYLWEAKLDKQLNNYFEKNEANLLKVFNDPENGQMAKNKNANALLDFLAFGVKHIDNKYGKTIPNALRKYSDFSVVTGVLKAKGDNWATVSAYVGPDPYSRTSNWESGIILNGSDGSHSSYDRSTDGYFEYRFRGLKKGVTYAYTTYFYDKVNAIALFGQQMYFTLGEMDLNFTYEIAPNPIYNDGYVTYDMTVKLTGDEELLDSASSFGVYLRNGDNYSANPVNALNSSVQVKCSVPREAFDKLNYSTFIAEATGNMIGAYYIEKGQDYATLLHERDFDGIIYSTKPNVTFTNVQVLGTTVIDHVIEDDEEYTYYETKYSFTLDVTGTFWMTTTQHIISGGGWDKTWEKDSYITDGSYSKNAYLFYWSDSSMKHTNHVLIYLSDGSTRTSSNCLLHGGTPTSPTITITGYSGTSSVAAQHDMLNNNSKTSTMSRSCVDAGSNPIPITTKTHTSNQHFLLPLNK